MSVVMHHIEKTVPEIHFTEDAVTHLVSYLQKNTQYKGVRLSVKNRVFRPILCHRLCIVASRRGFGVRLDKKLHRMY